MRSTPVLTPAYFYSDGQIMERTLDGSRPVDKARARILCVRLREQGIALEGVCPEVAAFVRALWIDLHNSLTGLRAAEQSERRDAA